MLQQIYGWLMEAALAFPPAFWYIAYLVTAKLTKRKAYAFRAACDSTTLLFIASVHRWSSGLWNESYLWVIYLVILASAVVISIIHYHSREDLEFFRVLKGIWRCSFFIFSAGYILLAGYWVYLQFTA